MILSIKQAPARITFGFQTGNLFALRDDLVAKKPRLAPHVHRVVVLKHRAARAGEIADEVVGESPACDKKVEESERLRSTEDLRFAS
jgi:hypothetical protein